ncbi:MAG: hypothetical protein DRJ15_15105, partial [Bacteroidetes bacterium]
ISKIKPKTTTPFKPDYFGKPSKDDQDAIDYLKEYVSILQPAEALIDNINHLAEDNQRPIFPAPSDDEIKQWERWIDTIERGVIRLSGVIGGVAAQAFTALSDAIAQSIIVGDTDAWSNALSSLGGIIQQFGALLIAWGVGWLAFQIGAANPYVAIAAGAALVAIGAGIKAVANKSQSASYTGSSTYTGSSNYASGVSALGGYDYNREVVLVARGEDLVAVINRVNYKSGIDG